MHLLPKESCVQAGKDEHSTKSNIVKTDVGDTPDLILADNVSNGGQVKGFYSEGAQPVSILGMSGESIHHCANALQESRQPSEKINSKTGRSSMSICICMRDDL